MAEILALGISHYPPLSGHDETMAGILKHMLQNPALPEKLKTPAGWPEGMRAEWGNDEGKSAATVHREKLVHWMRKARKALDDFKPDFVLIWGDDQYENFHEDIIPPYAISAHPSFEFGSPKNNVWGERSEKVNRVQGNVEAGKALATGLINSGFDVAYSYKPLHHPLGHAFTNAIFYLDYDRKGFPYPVVPFAINCYGRRVIAQKGGRPNFAKQLTASDLDPPAPTPWRLFDLGAETARILKESPWRVAILASSGWSHAFLTAKTHYLYPDTEADRGLYEAIRTGNYKYWKDYSATAVEDSGQQEVLNWMCLVGALNEMKRVPAEAGFVDTWIFNSSKCFVIAPPAA
jgi:LmbE family N-acetylglucosaminyl deacetylase